MSKNRFGVIGGGLLLVAVLGSIIPISGQTILSRILDNSGQSKLSTTLDYLVPSLSNPSFKSFINVDPLKPESCGSTWSAIKDQTIYSSNLGDKGKQSANFVGALSALGGLEKDMTFDIKGETRTDITKDYENIDFQTSGIFSYMIDLPSIYMKLKGIDSTLPDAPQGLSKVQGTLNGGTIVKNQDIFYKLEESNLVQPSQYAFKLNYPSWYKVDTTGQQDLSAYPQEIRDNPEFKKSFEESQQMLLVSKEITKEIDGYNKSKLKTTKYSDVMEEATYKELATAFCSVVENYEVGKTQTVDLAEAKWGEGKKDLRKVAIRLKPNYTSILADKVPNLLEKFSKDANFRKSATSYQDGIYDIQTKYADRLKMTPTKFDPTTFDKFDKSQIERSVSEFKSGIEQNVALSGELVTWLSAGDTTPYAQSYMLGFTPTYKYEQKGQGFDPLALWHNKNLNQGLIAAGATYNFKLGSSAKSIDDTKDAKNINELGNALAQEKGLSNLQQIFNPNSTPNPNGPSQQGISNGIVTKDAQAGPSMSEEEMTKFLNN
jgi:hypothetical protein